MPQLHGGKPPQTVINAPPANSAHGGAFIAKKMVGPNGFEPATSRLSGVRSNQLSYGPKKSAQLPYLKYLWKVKVFLKELCRVFNLSALSSIGSCDWQRIVMPFAVPSHGVRAVDRDTL